ncbi:MAG TPA: NADH dehydrogenase (quinone) subunit D [bacterium]|nr:NADH dehydrogenase (quinone) subunit D [bacterium]
MSHVTRETMTLNMGPQHPSTHGVLRLVLELEGEIVRTCTPIIGYLHTGIEKEMETRTYHQNVTLVDRVEYVASYMEEMAFYQSVERLMGIEPPPRAGAIRVLMCELNRIASHLVYLGSAAMDLNLSSVFMYCFADREKFLDLSEMVSGQRMMPGYFRVGGVADDLPEEFFPAARAFLDEIPRRVDEYTRLLSDNLIWRERLEGVALLSREDAIRLGATGPVLRGSGVVHDIRKLLPYGGYDEYDFDIPTRPDGDAYARYIVRMEEMRQSRRIALRALERLPDGPVIVADRKVALPPRAELARSMEAVIHQFKLVSEGMHPPAGDSYVATESARGEKGYYVVSDGSNRPVRVHIRAPSFYNLQTLPAMVEGRPLADVVVAVASIDIILGDVDR